MALLLYRQIAAELGELKETEVAVEAIWIDQHSDLQERDVVDYMSHLPFVEETEEKGQYFILEYRIEAALDHLSSIG